MPFVFGIYSYTYGLSKQCGDIKMAFISSGLSNTTNKSGPTYALNGVPNSLENFKTSLKSCTSDLEASTWAFPMNGKMVPLVFKCFTYPSIRFMCTKYFTTIVVTKNTHNSKEIIFHCYLSRIILVSQSNQKKIWYIQWKNCNSKCE